MSKIICHRCDWNNNPLLQNTVEAALSAFSKGLGVELDIRASEDGTLGTGHDTYQIFDWKALMSFPDRGFIAFHVKEKGLATKLYDITKQSSYLEYLIFGIPEEEMSLYMSLFGKEHIAFEYTSGDNFEKVFNCQNENIWISELNRHQVGKKEMTILKSQGKKLYLVMPDAVGGDKILEGVRIMNFKDGLFEGIITDLPEIINNY
jgi:glycerophosphoryl diester phosphodiesterase